jgi:hypothetical protein
MVDGSPHETTQLVWDVNTGAFGPPRSDAERATHLFIKGPTAIALVSESVGLTRESTPRRARPVVGEGTLPRGNLPVQTESGRNTRHITILEFRG